jgi:hypothetical protein
MQFPQKQITFAALQATIRPPPFQQFANRCRQFGQREIRELPRDLANQN